MNNRREFLADVGRGMLVASVGSALAADLGLARVYAGEPAERLTFGAMEPLVSLMQETPADKLLPIVVEKLQGGTELRTVVAAAALANARTFGGHDYDGYHTFMALTPSYQMAHELPEDRRALPVLKVLHRNSRFIERFGGKQKESLHALEHAIHEGNRPESAGVRDATRKIDRTGAERNLAASAASSNEEAYNQVLMAIQDDVDVHRTVLAWRAWATLELTGREQAVTLLRQSVRFCVDAEQRQKSQKRPPAGIRTLLPKLLDQYKLVGKKAGDRKADDAWIEKLCQTIYAGGRDQAADAAAAALAEGMNPEYVGEAISLAANRLLLRDQGQDRASAGKPVGSVHGASVGVHASDSANAWRNIARVSNQRNAVASLIVAAYHTAGQAGRAARQPLPWAEHLSAVKSKDEKSLLADAEAAIKARDQGRACAVVQRYGELGLPSRPVFDLMLRFALSEDGALHAEKYYRTVAEEFAISRPAFRWRHLVALARVTASEYGFPAPGYADACRLLKV